MVFHLHERGRIVVEARRRKGIDDGKNQFLGVFIDEDVVFSRQAHQSIGKVPSYRTSGDSFAQERATFKSGIQRVDLEP